MLATRHLMVFSLCSLAFVIPAFSQGTRPPLKEDSLYSAALFASIAEMKKSWGNIDDTNGGKSVRKDYSNVVVEKERNVTDGLPTERGAYRVEYLDDQELIARCKKLRKEFPVFRIFPIDGRETRLNIQISVYYVSYKKGKLMFGLSDWSVVELRYDCGAQQFIVSSLKLGGT